MPDVAPAPAYTLRPVTAGVSAVLYDFRVACLKPYGEPTWGWEAAIQRAAVKFREVFRRSGRHKGQAALMVVLSVAALSVLGQLGYFAYLPDRDFPGNLRGATLPVSFDRAVVLVRPHGAQHPATG